MKFTQSLSMHLNGGSEFSELHYNVLADGKPTAIKRLKRTDGSPKYLITHDVFFCGEDRDSFDNLEKKGVGLTEWLEAHTGQASS